MVIHAIYENGVFRPVQPVELPERCEVDLLIQTQGVANAAPSAAMPLAKLAALAAEHPDNLALPTDLAEQHDHYLYGAPKRS